MNMREILALAPVIPVLTVSVVSLGGSWMAPPEMIAAGDWQGIGALARDAAALKIGYIS